MHAARNLKKVSIETKLPTRLGEEPVFKAEGISGKGVATAEKFTGNN